MRLIRFASFVALALCGLSVSSLQAQMQQTLRETFDRLDANGDMVIERSEVPEAALPAFEKLLKAGDTNKDGKIQIEEMRTIYQSGMRANPALMKERLAAMDTDKDGKVSKAEFTGIPANFARMDADSDGFLSKDEIDRASKAMGAATAPAEQIQRLKAMDTDKDGKITRAEFKGQPGMFARLDKNQDGVISADEMPAGVPATAKAKMKTAATPRAASGELGPRLKAMDTDGDGKLSKAEFKGPEAMFDQLDLNKDGSITGEEQSQAAQALKTRLQAMDSDGDGKISKDEYKGSAESFDRLDVNKDGVISKDDTPVQTPKAATGKAAKAKAKAKAADPE